MLIKDKKYEFTLLNTPAVHIYTSPESRNVLYAQGKFLYIITNSKFKLAR